MSSADFVNLDNQLIPKEFPKNSQRIPKDFLRFSKYHTREFQFPTSHLEAENPFGLVSM